uniref:DNA polymerase delta subunit 3 n=1 Tax=Rhipicephalus appendiculatus TaxID=34631 RepID=A0A131YD71_RHIAP
MDSSVRDQLESEVVYDRHVATYKWLASKFDLHTNTAKRYLKEFTNEQEADGSNVIGHSIVTGLQDKLYRIILTTSQSVSEAKKDLTTVTGVHAFSAQPSNLEDCIDRLTEAAMSDCKLSVCPIYCEAAQRTRGARKGLNGVSTAAERKAVSPAKPPPRAQESKAAPTKSEPVVKTEKDKPASTSKGSAKSKPKQNNLAAAFGKARTAASSASSKSTPPTEKKDADDIKATPKGASSSGETAKRKSVGKSPSDKSTPEKKRIKTEVPTSPEVSSATRKKAIAETHHQ